MLSCRIASVEAASDRACCRLAPFHQDRSAGRVRRYPTHHRCAVGGDRSAAACRVTRGRSVARTLIPGVLRAVVPPSARDEYHERDYRSTAVRAYCLVMEITPAGGRRGRPARQAPRRAWPGGLVDFPPRRRRRGAQATDEPPSRAPVGVEELGRAGAARVPARPTLP